MNIIQNTPVPIPFYVHDSGSAQTGLALTLNVEFSKDGATFVTATNTPVEIGNGWYTIMPTLAEVDTLGEFYLFAENTGADDVGDLHQVIVDTEIANDIWNAALVNYPNVGSSGYTLNQLNQMITATTINIQSVFAGGVMNLLTYNTWEIPIDGLPDLTGYTAIVLIIKINAFQDDVRSQLLLRSDTGLIVIGGADPVVAGNGTLTVQGDYRSIIAEVDIVETGAARAGEYQWWIRGLTATGGFDLMTGSCVIEVGGTQVVS